MSNKKEIKELDKTFKVYTVLQLKIQKQEAFEPKHLTDILISGMKQMKKFKELSGHEKKEKLIQMIKLLIKEHGDISEWIDFDSETIPHIIDSLYEGGIVKGCCSLL